MLKPSKFARITTGTFAAAAIVLMGAAVPAGAGNPNPSSPYVQVAAQQMKKLPPRGTGPTRPFAGSHKMSNGSGASANNQGCHDGASQTSYEGPCDNHPEYEATGGCQSDATQTSYPGNCANSSEP